MASYNVRQRDPLLDQDTQAMLERRGRELLGVGLIAAALAFAAMFASYTPDDPGWMVATDAAVNNWMGRFGAAVASTLFIIGGKGVWGIPVILGIWGVRFVAHVGQNRAIGRVVFAVIAVALGSVFAATHVPGPDWPHPAIGLGGLFGDTMLGALLAILPVGAGLGLKLLSVVFGIALLAMGLYVTGFDLAELRRIGRFLMIGTTLVYAQLLTLAGRSAAGTLRAAAAMQHRARTRREAAHDPAPALLDHGQMQPAPLHAGTAAYGAAPALRGARRIDADPVIEPQVAPRDRPAERAGLLARMPQLIRRAAPVEAATLAPVTAGPEDRIKARINDVIRSRVRPPIQAQNPVQAAIARREPPLNRRGPQPLIATRLPQTSALLPPEPPVTAKALATGAAAVASALAAPSAFAAAHQRAPTAEAWDMQDDPSDMPDDLHHDARDQFDDEDDDYDFGPEPQIVTVSAPSSRSAMPETRRIVQPVAKKPIAPSRQALSEAQPSLRFEEVQNSYELPPLNLLASPDSVQRHSLSEDALEENARMLESVLDDYGVKGEIVSVRPGPVVTMYELEPAPGLKASRVIGLADDIARSMSALSARVSTVPGRSVIGIELPNAWREKVVLREILAARDFGDSGLRLPLALGKDIGGEPIVANLAKMPHLLIAGTTGSGKSVAINTMILSLLYKLTPEECRLIMIDPKMLELSVYDGIPHLLSPVVTDPKKAVVALKWVVGEMEERYRKMSKMGVRNIEGYNGRVREALAKGELFRR
ncbi:MAG: DNA translocase FtsK 4TM domain-containing protein, partial [Pseudorhodobacter sp.]